MKSGLSLAKNALGGMGGGGYAGPPALGGMEAHGAANVQTDGGDDDGGRKLPMGLIAAGAAAWYFFGRKGR